jgi:hypothetical protein
MSLGIRGFIEYLVKKIEDEGIMSGGYYSQSETESDVIDMIWSAYESYEKVND